jgi:hypothetical protein
VSWAISIIVYESADATDLNDGFGTGELVIGIRAYQWGWEYYYPRSIDLNYNVRPSYSSFIGNSLKYTYSSGAHLETNNLWKLYQGKLDDKVVVPANLLLLPLDNMKSVNANTLSFIGSDLLKGQEAFQKARSVTKSFSTNLFQNFSLQNTLNTDLESFYRNDTLFTGSLHYGLLRQHNLLPGSNLNISPMLDSRAGESLSDNIFSKSFFDEKTNLQGDLIDHSNEAKLLGSIASDIPEDHLTKTLLNSNTYLSGDATTSSPLTIKTISPFSADLNNKKQNFFQGRS